MATKKTDQDPEKQTSEQKVTKILVPMRSDLAEEIERIADEEGVPTLVLIRRFLEQGVYLRKVRKDGGKITIKGKDGIEITIIRWALEEEKYGS